MSNNKIINKIEKIYIKTYGCSLNKSDSLTMINLLEKSGYKITNNEDDCDAVIINSCTVKNSAEAKLFVDIDKFQKKGLVNIIIAGCVPQAQKNLQVFDYNTIVGVERITQIPQIIKCLEQGYVVQDLDRDNTDSLDVPKRLNKTIEIVPISKGCLGNCTYCKTHQARGVLSSFNKKRITNSINKALKTGAKEIWLTSQDNGAYGLDINENLVSLLKHILKNTPEDYKIRIGMANPNHIIDYLDDLIEIYKDKRLYKFLHIPIQSGSNRILKLMNRFYTSAEFEKIIKKFKNHFEDFTFATDIIVGFPTESTSDFQKSYDIIEKYEIPVVNISRFWPRPDTPAENLEELDVEIVKERTKKLMDLHKKVTQNYLKKFLNQELDILINEKEKEFVARTNSYIKVLLSDEEIKNSKSNLSEFKKVKITNTSQWHLRAKIVN